MANFLGHNLGNLMLKALDSPERAALEAINLIRNLLKVTCAADPDVGATGRSGWRLTIRHEICGEVNNIDQEGLRRRRPR